MSVAANARSSVFRVFLVGTEFCRARGGIQYVNRLLGRTFAELESVVPCELHLFSYADELSCVGFPVGETHAARWHGFNHRPGSMAARFAERLLRVQPQVVLFTHVNLLPLSLLARWLAPRSAVALLTHGAEVWRPLAARSRMCLHRLDAVVSPSDFTARSLVEVQGLMPQKISTIPHGLDPDWTSAARQAAPGRKGGSTLLTVARLSRDDLRVGQKGVEDVLRAMPRILSRCPDARCVIVGDGDDRARLASLARQLQVAQVVEFRGELDDTQLIHAYAEADLFVLPSQLEGFGLAFVEAMFCGLPVVAARAAAAPEVVEDGVTGILVSPDSHEALASAVAGLLLLPEERERMSRAARIRVDQNYMFTHFSRRWRHWLAQVAPEALYLARHAAAFARRLPTTQPSRESVRQASPRAARAR